MPDRSALKRNATEKIRTSNPKVITVALVYLLLSLLVNLLSSRLLSVNMTDADAARYLQYYAEGNYEYALRYLDIISPPATSYFLDTLLTIVMSIVGAGFILFLLNTVRGNAPCFGNLLDGFGFGLKVVILNVLEAVFIGLWSMLLMFPGIIAYYRYSQAIYILVDNPTKSPMQCIRESKAMMSGHKGELFALDLSFLGWYLLSLIPVLGYAVRVWTVPYIGMTKTLYFEALRGGAAYTRDTFNVDI